MFERLREFLCEVVDVRGVDLPLIAITGSSVVAYEVLLGVEVTLFLLAFA